MWYVNVAEIKGEGAEEVIDEAEMGGEGPPEENLVEELIAPQPHWVNHPAAKQVWHTEG